jgi:hypothetical protein
MNYTVRASMDLVSTSLPQARLQTAFYAAAKSFPFKIIRRSISFSG